MATILSKVWTSPGDQLASSITEEVSTGADEKAIIDKAIFFNTNSSDETVKGYIETTGGSPGAADQVFEFVIPAGETRDSGLPVNIRLGNSQGLFFVTTTASKVNFHISGRRIVG